MKHVLCVLCLLHILLGTLSSHIDTATLDTTEISYWCDDEKIEHVLQNIDQLQTTFSGYIAQESQRLSRRKKIKILRYLALDTHHFFHNSTEQIKELEVGLLIKMSHIGQIFGEPLYEILQIMAFIEYLQ